MSNRNFEKSLSEPQHIERELNLDNDSIVDGYAKKTVEDFFDEFNENVDEFENVKINLNNDRINLRKRVALEQIKRFCHRVSFDFKNKIEQLIQDENVPTKIANWLREKDFNLPDFSVYDQKTAKDFLNDCGLNSEIDGNELLLVFQLPKPLAQFWDKGGQEFWGNRAKNAEGSVVEWGRFYRQVMPIIWNIQGYYEDELGMVFRRKNNLSQHDPLKYYYIWSVTWGEI